MQAGCSRLLLSVLSAISLTALQNSATAQATLVDTLGNIQPLVPARVDTSYAWFLKANPFINANAPLVYQVEQPFEAPQKDAIFYALGGLLLLLAILRVGFTKYFADMMRIFFQTAFRQKSTREQLGQNTLAGLLFNVFFCISGGVFIYQLARYRGWISQGIWWHQILLCVALLAVVYLVKYMSLKLSGWLFGMREVAETYSFMVFLINKVVGILLLPATWVLALGSSSLQPVFVAVSLAGLALLFCYRYFIAVPLVRNQTRISSLHFFLYLCAFEILPVLLIYKLLLTFISR